MKTKVALVGLGRVGTAVYENLLQQHDSQVEVCRIAVRDLAKDRGLQVPPGLLTTDVAAVLKDDSIDVVVELTSGTDPALSIITGALLNGKHVVTANKDVIAQHGRDIFALADQVGCRVGFEASVLAGIPIVRSLQDHVTHDEVRVVAAIANGTTNYCLTAMASEWKPSIKNDLHAGAQRRRCGVYDLSRSLGEAVARGLAESDATKDLDGTDARFKIAILGSLALKSRVGVGDVHCEGIRNADGSEVEPFDLWFARGRGYAIKLLGVVKEVDGEITAGVYPALVPVGHYLASTEWEYNAIWLGGGRLENQFYYGLGAGPAPTSVAVVSDIFEIANANGSKVRTRCHALFGQVRLPIRRFDSTVTRGFIRSYSPDVPGVFEAKLHVLAKHSLSVQELRNLLDEESVERQRFSSTAPDGTVVMPDTILISGAPDGEVRRALNELRELRLSDGTRCVYGAPMYFRIEDGF